MGKGLAYEFRLRSRIMYERYKQFCNDGTLTIGKLWIYKMGKYDAGNFEKILNFPTKDNWRQPSQKYYIEIGLQKFVDSYKQKGIESIAFPLLGVDLGKLDKEWVIETMQRYLCDLDLYIEIWEFDEKAKDDTFEILKDFILYYENRPKELLKLKEFATEQNYQIYGCTDDNKKCDKEDETEDNKKNLKNVNVMLIFTKLKFY